MGCMIRLRLESFIKRRCCTLLGVGPMSKNCVDAAIEIANDFEIYIILVASRRQIECAEFGGGYVNNWTTEEFARYVKKYDKKGKIILERDHGGPWQNSFEKEQKLSLKNAMEFAKQSYAVDIQSGFEIIHIDPSEDIFTQPSLDEILLRVFELYEFCWITAQRLNREILFEIGTEEQNGSVNDIEAFEYVLNEIRNFTVKNKLPEPTFIVAQTGTKVLENRNVGTLDSPFRIAYEIPAEIQFPKFIDTCNKYNIFLKQHNTDYLSDEILRWLPKLKIHAANVAPEFGLAETVAFVDLLKEFNLADLHEQFIDLAYNSKKWGKWMLPNSKASKEEKAIIAGHYVFADKRFIDIKHNAQQSLLTKGICIEENLKKRVKDSIMRYIKNFKLL